MKILIIDGNNLMYRALHAYSKLQNNGNPVSVIYGMPILVNGLIAQFSPDKVYICWDGKRSEHRLKLHPGYKQGRKVRTEEELKNINNQKRETMHLFNCLGLKQVYHIDMEADDYIYMLVRKFKKNPDNKITIASSDKDFHQLIRSNVKVYNVAQKKLIHKKNLKLNYGYEPHECVDFLSIVGDDSDNIGGIKGIGEKGAAKLLNEFKSLKLLIKSGKSFGKIDNSIIKEVYTLNRKLIDLKYFYKLFLKGNIKINLFHREPEFDKKGLFRICDKYFIKGFKENKFLKNYENKNY